MFSSDVTHQNSVDHFEEYRAERASPVDSLPRCALSNRFRSAFTPVSDMLYDCPCSHVLSRCCVVCYCSVTSPSPHSTMDRQYSPPKSRLAYSSSRETRSLMNDVLRG
eukprot:5555522-Pyramimonas_sp.AAC.1